MAIVALFVHPRRPRAVSQAAQVAAWLTERGHEVHAPKDDAQAVGLDQAGRDPADLGAEIDLAVALGGDGTMLRAVHQMSEHGTPVLGVNLGYLGFLTAVEPGAVLDALDAFLSGRHQIEERMMLDVTVTRSDGTGSSARALNEVVVEKQRPGHTVRLTVSITGRPWTTYVADGLIVASPTGSTAYSFSARGPVVGPGVRAMVVTPISPHMPFDRSLVVADDETVRIEIADDRSASLGVDGRDTEALDAGDVLTVGTAPVPARLVTFGARDFFAVLKAKFGVGN